MMKAVIPAAGLGTRFLPATKAQPKEMLPVVDKPAIQYVVEEAVAAGLDDILIVTGRGKRAIEDHFDNSFELEEKLEKTANTVAAAALANIANLGHIHYIRQKQRLGLGNAVYCARKYIGDNPFSVMLGDTITMSKTPCIRELQNVFNEKQASVIAVHRVPADKIGAYGIIDAEPAGDNLFKINSLIEKPEPQDAPSDLAVLGRYILTPGIFSCLERTAPDKNGEVQLTDAIRLLLESEPVYAVEFTGRHYDIGDKLGWLKAIFEIAMDRPDLGPDLREYLTRYLSRSGAGDATG